LVLIVEIVSSGKIMARRDERRWQRQYVTMSVVAGPLLRNGLVTRYSIG
jgi:hypothetical protein